ncbi:Mitochondrial-processing peptidase subunit alpha [Acorus calamus]|uniref:Alpha-MPP n=1 Tax=Acorus calamus TaxID=4465 RepID=A0AAV9DG45_ACOCL|nr:Mitochondrial-processing peptidase subunit alpha [Acorus calamus]
MFRASNRSLLRKLRESAVRRVRYESSYATGNQCERVSSKGGPLSWFRSSYTERFPSLLQPITDITIPDYLPDRVEFHTTKITTLPNGLRVASEDSPGPAACLGLFVDCGSIYEDENSVGTTHLLERMAFKTTKNRSHVHIVSEIEAFGGNVGASASRDTMGYSYDTLKTHLPEAVELLIDCIRNPMFLKDEVTEQVAKVKQEIEEISNDPQNFLLECLHSTGYSGALGNPLMAPKSALDKINGSIIEKFYYENYTADRMVLAAYGMDHEKLLKMVEPLLHDLQSGVCKETPKSTYVGGDFRYKANSENTHVALAFEVPGGWHEDKDATAMTVLQTLMGGGGSFSAGGPGKGMHSRLYLRVLNKYHQVQSFSAFSSVYDDSGLFGIHLVTGSDFVEKAVHVAADELLAIATPGQVTERELLRAKNSTKSAVLINLESRVINAEDIGRQVLIYGCRKPVQYFLQCLEELTIDDLVVLAQKILSSPLTMSSWGAVDQVPDYNTVSRRFRNA